LIHGNEKISLNVRHDETILDAALRADIELPYTCLQGWCISCAGKILKGSVDQTSALRVFPQDMEQGFVLLCSAFPKSDLEILTHQKEELRIFRISQKLPAPMG